MGRRNAFKGDGETVYNSCVRDDPIESPVTLRRNPSVVEQVDDETFAAVTSKLFGDDGDPDLGAEPGAGGWTCTAKIFGRAEQATGFKRLGDNSD